MRRFGWAILVLGLVACSDGPDSSPLPQTLPPATSSSVADTSVPVPTTAAVPPSVIASTSTSPPTTLAPLSALGYSGPVPADFPIVLTARPGDPYALLAERSGLIYRFENGVPGEVVGDISDLTRTDGERGLLGMVRHPEDDTRLFIHYSDAAGDTVVSEFFYPEEVDVASERVLLSVEQPASNHNGGMIQFGPDGALYVGLGDGGGAGDLFGHGQDPETLLGSIVRVDVETADATLWQFGLRNPWRFWIDGDDIWIGDVGQGSYEEVDLASIAEEGINYGWSVMEGNHCFGTRDCDTAGITLPLIEVERGDGGTCSITGGVVYRGRAIPELAGRFLFSDYCGGYLRSVDKSATVVDHTGDVGEAGSVVSFGVDGDGEVYVLTTNEILRLVPVR